VYTQRMDRSSRNRARVTALIASIVTAMLLAIGCGQSVPAAQPAPSRGGGGGIGQLVS